MTTESVVHAMVASALAQARAEPTGAGDRRRVHAARSRAFVTALASGLRTQFAAEPNVRVFDKYHDGNRAAFGLNEMLYDVTVCRVAVTQGKELWYVSKPIWQIESEFAKDRRQALFDFSKLVLGAAPLKLFVGPAVAANESFIDTMREAAACCTGRVFIALVPHPDAWDAASDEVLCRELPALSAPSASEPRTRT